MPSRALTLLLLLCLAATLRAELALAPHPWLAPLEPQAPPALDAGDTLSLRLTPGEYEPAAFAARPDHPVTVTIEYQGGPGQSLPPSWVELQVVRGRTDSTALNRLFEIDGPLALPAGRTSYFWVTVRAHSLAGPGRYEGRVVFREQGGGELGALRLSCEVLPFRLAESRVTGGVFMAGTSLPPGWYRDIKEHGLEAIQCFWSGAGIGIGREEDQLRLEFSRLDALLADLNASGLRGPVVVSLGNDHSLHFECRLAEAFGIPVDTGEVIDGKRVIGPAVSPQLDSLFVEGLRQLRAHWDNRGYPQELVVLIYDEPTERLLERCRHRYDLLRGAIPGTRVYGVVMNRREWAESMLDQCEIVVSDGDFPGCREAARSRGKDFWIYSFPLGQVHTARYDMGCLPWRVEADGAFFWMYNYWNFDPDGCAVYPHPDDPRLPVRSVAWEGVREGLDDLRYFATAEKLVERCPEAGREQAHRRLAEIRESIDPTRRRPAPLGERHDELSVLEHYGEPEAIRGRVIALILELRRLVEPGGGNN